MKLEISNQEESPKPATKLIETGSAADYDLNSKIKQDSSD